MPLRLLFAMMTILMPSSDIFFFNDTATTEIYTLSLHDALPISGRRGRADQSSRCRDGDVDGTPAADRSVGPASRSEEHTSELQSRLHLVCRLLLEKKKEHGSYPTVTGTVPEQADRC